jgi:hypothetical protein
MRTDTDELTYQLQQIVYSLRVHNSLTTSAQGYRSSCQYAVRNTGVLAFS